MVTAAEQTVDRGDGIEDMLAAGAVHLAGR